MGKTRKNRKFAKASKIDPTNSKSYTSDNEFVQGDEIGEDLLQKIANNLKSVSSIDKECGCSTLAMVTESQIEVILERKLARMAGPLMVDKDPSVSHAAVGGLVNISLSSHDVCEELVNQDVMTPLCKLLASYDSESSKDWSKKGALNELKSLKEEIFIKAVTLVWNLCEASETAIKIFNSQNIVHLLLSYINVEKYGIDVVACVLQCIYSISENNIPAITAIKERGIENIFNQFFKPNYIDNESEHAKDESNNALASQLYLRILACGITIAVLDDTKTNGVFSPDSNLSAQVLPILINTASDILDQDQRKLIHEYSSLAPLYEEENGPYDPKYKELLKNGENMDQEKMDDESADNISNNSKSVGRKQLNSLSAEINHVLLGQQMTCEILTNLCCDGENESENWEDDSDASYSDMDECDEVDADQSTTAKEINNSNNIPTVILEAFVSNNLVSKVLAKANFPAENVCEILREKNVAMSKSQLKVDGQTIMKMLSTLRSRAFLCVNNMLGSNLSVEDLGGPEAIFSVWSNLGMLCFQNEKNGSSGTIRAKHDQELLESATSAMRATTQKLFEAKCSDPFNSICKSDIEKMIEFGSTSPEANIRINMVQIIGNLGAMSTLPNVGLNLSESSPMLAQFLLDAAAKDADIRVVAEALDKIFDMFAEDYTDILCIRVNLVSQLKKILPTLKIKIGLIKKGKRQEVEECFLPVVNIAKTNLSRFIKYKESSKR